MRGGRIQGHLARSAHTCDGVAISPKDVGGPRGSLEPSASLPASDLGPVGAPDRGVATQTARTRSARIGRHRRAARRRRCIGCLVRHGLHRLAWMDSTVPAGSIRRIEHRPCRASSSTSTSRNWRRIPDGGGWREPWPRPRTGAASHQVERRCSSRRSSASKRTGSSEPSERRRRRNWSRPVVLHDLGDLEAAAPPRLEAGAHFDVGAGPHAAPA